MEIEPTAPGPKRSRRKLVLTPFGVVVLLAVIAVLATLLASALGSGEPSGTPTVGRTAPAVGTPTAVAVTRVPAETPSAAELSPEEFTRWLDRAGGLVLESRVEEAAAIYQDLARRVPDDARVEAAWARALLLDDQVDEALIHARRAVELDPIRSEAASALAAAYLAAGDMSRATAMAESAVQLNARSAAAHAVLAEAHLRAGRPRLAVAEAQAALDQDGDSAAALRILGRIYQEVEGDRPRAIESLRAAVRAEPGVWRWHQELGLLLLEAGSDDEAVEAFKRALALRPKAATYTALAEAYSRLGQRDEAILVLEQALALGADDAQTLGLLAVLLAELDRCDDARVYYEQALARDAAEPRALQARGRCEGSTVPPSTPDISPPTGTPAPTAGRLSTSAPAPAGWIAFPQWDGPTGKYDTYLARTDGSARRLVAGQTHQPALRPDGAWLAVDSQRPLQENLIVVRPDGSDALEVSKHAEDGQPAWSPDGKRLAFSSTQHGDRQSRVYILDPVPMDGSKADGWPLMAGADEARGEFPAWTADGRIVYSGCDYSASPVQCGLLMLTVQPGTQTPQRLTDHPGDAAPAVYGDQVVFMSNRDGNWEIYRVQLDGSGLQRLTDGAAIDGLPVWSPDGQSIAFVSDDGGRWAVWSMRPDGSDRRLLFELGGAGLGPDWQRERISWGP